jgi:hypothetical protein
MFGWFKKKVAIQTPDGRTVRIPEAHVDKWEREGHLKPVIEVIVDDIDDDGEKTIRWVVGEDVDRETYERLRDEEGKLHVLTFYRKGVKEARVTTREMYYMARTKAGHAIETNDLREWAEGGNVEAQYMLAGILAGRDVPEDDLEAAKWFRRAAGQGHALAQLALGLAYLGGTGVPKDLCLACMWCNIAELQGLEVAAAVRKQATDQMTPAQIAEAEKRVRGWKPTANSSMAPQRRSH